MRRLSTKVLHLTVRYGWTISTIGLITECLRPETTACQNAFVHNIAQDRLNQRLQPAGLGHILHIGKETPQPANILRTAIVQLFL
jgi:hypothetical protein